MNKKVLFICKDRGYGSSFGLFLSAQFVVKALQMEGIEAKVVSVVDGNSIDKEVHQYKPTDVIIEALWVTPLKIKELVKLHPKVKWVVRVHSEIPFIANEGISFEWMFEYQKVNNVQVAANSKRMNVDLVNVDIKSQYLPNIYFPAFIEQPVSKHHECPFVINIGCFGAIRPLKNQLEQAVAAITFANMNNKTLRFHINSDRIEQQGNSTLKNIRALFQNSKPHELIEHGWMKHQDFVELVKTMDMGMQVSFSETFNIVTADFVNNGIPIVVSEEITWMPWWTKASPTQTEEIVEVMNLCYFCRKFKLQYLNEIRLGKYNLQSLKTWIEYVE